MIHNSDMPYPPKVAEYWKKHDRLTFFTQSNVRETVPCYNMKQAQTIIKDKGYKNQIVKYV